MGSARRRRGSIFALCCVLSALSPGLALAQRVDATGDALAAPRTPSASSSATRSGRAPSTDELDEQASSGPTLAAREMAIRSGHPLDERATAPDYSDPDLPVALQLSIGGGSTLGRTSLDYALMSHDYGNSQGFYRGEVAILGRALSWLWLGGRLGGRARVFPRNDGQGGDAGGVDLLALVEVRFQLGRVIELGAHVGGGAGVATLRLRHDVSLGFVPRVTGGVHVAFRLERGLRLFVRGSYDYFPWFDVDRYGDDLDLGGLSAVLGLEVRT